MMKTLLLLTAVSIFGLQAHAWGHLSWLETDVNKDAYLIYHSIRDKKINYCVEVKDTKAYSDASLAMQTKMALTVWLRYLELTTAAHVKISRVPCSSPTVNLRVVAEPDFAKGEDGFARTTPQPSEHGPFINIELNTGCRQKDYNNEMIAGMDFSKVWNGNVSAMQTVIRQISFEHLQTVDGFAQGYLKNRYSKSAVSYMSYSVLIHEMGHAFGLCDTMPKHGHNCDQDFRSKDLSDPTAVMFRPQAYYPQHDDLIGLLELYKRFKDLAPTDKQGKSEKPKGKTAI
jgi:hypothetical protein